MTAAPHAKGLVPSGVLADVLECVRSRSMEAILGTVLADVFAAARARPDCRRCGWRALSNARDAQGIYPPGKAAKRP